MVLATMEVVDDHERYFAYGYISKKNPAKFAHKLNVEFEQKKEITNYSQDFELSNCKNRSIIYGDQEGYKRDRFGV